VASGRARYGERFVAPFYGSGSGATGRSVHRPIGTLTTVDRWAVIDGDRMRVLQPSENRSIMSFPEDTQLPYVKRDAMHLLGNAVCPLQGKDVLEAVAAAL
jgi:DNA (cytosine-5)-methyltransferase 1